MRIRFLLGLTLAITAVLAGCGDAALMEDDDVELAVGVDGKADRAASSIAAMSATYYEVRVDARRCAFPMCGGYLVNRANFSTTRCNDGGYRDACYVVDMDLANGVGLSPDEIDAFRADIRAGRALLRGSIKSATYGSQLLGFFVPTEAWRSATDRAPTGTFYKVTDRHVVCVAAPCPSYQEYKLNSTRNQPIHDIDLSAAGGDATTMNAVLSGIDQVPVLAVGQNDSYATGGRTGTRLDANQYYLRVSP